MICGGECGRRLLQQDFYASNQARCKACVRASAAARRQADPEAHREATRRWRAREELRAAVLEHVLRILAARDPREFFEAVMDAEDALGLEAGEALELFSQNHVSSPKGESTTTRRDQDVA